MPGWRWLTFPALASSLVDLELWPGASVDRVVYCTAPRDRAGDPTSVQDQQTYLTALQHLPVAVQVVYGYYVPRVKSGALVNHRYRRVEPPADAEVPDWLPLKRVEGPEGTDVLLVRVTTFEEKGSDVNVATHLLVDVLTGAVDAAIVISNDSDLAEPLRHVRERVPVGTVNPGVSATSKALRGASDDGVGRHWWRRLVGPDYKVFCPTLAHANPTQAWASRTLPVFEEFYAAIEQMALEAGAAGHSITQTGALNAAAPAVDLVRERVAKAVATARQCPPPPDPGSAHALALLPSSRGPATFTGFGAGAVRR